MFFTPSGRFEVNTKICLSFTNYHPEYWQPAWTIESILLAIVSFMPVEEDIPGVGAMNITGKLRIEIAKNSHSWTCKTCKMSN
jgi:ubiquitin-conjugating enzyme E2 J1